MQRCVHCEAGYLSGKRFSSVFAAAGTGQVIFFALIVNTVNNENGINTCVVDNDVTWVCTGIVECLYRHRLAEQSPATATAGVVRKSRHGIEVGKRSEEHTSELQSLMR